MDHCKHSCERRTQTLYRVYPTQCNLRLDTDSLPLFTFCNALLHLLFVHLFFEKLSRKFSFALTFDIAKCSQIVAKCVLSSTQSFSKVFAQRYERSAHDAVGHDLVVVRLQ